MLTIKTDYYEKLKQQDDFINAFKGLIAVHFTK